MATREPLVDLSVQYRPPLFPFRIESFTEVLPHLGFVVPEQIQRQFNARLRLDGPIGMKGEIRLWANTDRRTIGVRGHEHDHVTDEFVAMEEALDERLNFKSSERAEFYEIQMQALVEAREHSPLAVTQRQFEGADLWRRLGAVLGQPVINFGFRIVPPGRVPNSINWFDIRIEPEVLQPDRLYLVQVVLREAEREQVIQTSRKGPGFIEEIVRAVERHS